MKRTPLRPVSARRRKRDRDYPRQRQAVWQRSGGLCEAPVHALECSGQCEQVHHIAGREGPDPHRLDNLVGLSRACHWAAHSEPAWAAKVGLTRTRHGGAA